MVGHIEHDGFLLLKTADDLIYDRVVVEQGIIVVGQSLTLLGIEFRTVVVVTRPAHLRFRATGAVIYMLSFQVEDDEVVVGVLVLQPVVIAEQSFVEVTQFCIAGVEHRL